MFHGPRDQQPPRHRRQRTRTALQQPGACCPGCSRRQSDSPQSEQRRRRCFEGRALSRGGRAAARMCGRCLRTWLAQAAVGVEACRCPHSARTANRRIGAAGAASSSLSSSVLSARAPTGTCHTAAAAAGHARGIEVGRWAGGTLKYGGQAPASASSTSMRPAASLPQKSTTLRSEFLLHIAARKLLIV